MKKYVLPALGVFGAASASALAEGTSNLPANFTSSLDTFKGTAIEAIDAVVPVVSDVLIALFVITAIWFVYHAVRKALR